MDLRITADDFGLTRGITDTILQAIDGGYISSVSIIANGQDFDRSMVELARRPGVRLSVHLNLSEGAPLSPAGKLGELCGPDGRLRQSFLRVWLTYLLAPAAKKHLLRRQVRAEYDAQLARVRAAAPRGWEVSVDSHQHLHMVPFVFEALLELREKHAIRHVRMPDEPFFAAREVGQFLRNVLSSNLIKHVLLRLLSRAHKRKLDRLGVAYPAAFFGVLYTGRMTEKTIRDALLAARGMHGEVELLVHAGSATIEEEHLWNGRQDLRDYYRSGWRVIERDSIRSPRLRRLIRAVKRAA